MKQNIYDNEVFFKEYNNMRITKKGISANDLIEIPNNSQYVARFKK